MNSTQAKTIALSHVRSRMTVAAEVTKDFMHHLWRHDRSVLFDFFYDGNPEKLLSDNLSALGFREFFVGCTEMHQGANDFLEIIILRRDPSKGLDIEDVTIMTITRHIL